MIDIQCKSCGGELAFDPDSGELKCKQCSSIVDIPEEHAIAIKKPFTDTSEIEKSQEEYTQYSCSTCGRKHIVPSNQNVLYCPSCGDASSLTKAVNIQYLPDGIIPFKLNKEKALNSFKDWLKRRRFAPNNLKRLAKTQSLTGVYLPVYNYDFDCFTHYSGVGIREHRDSDGHTHTSRHPFNSSRTDRFNNYVDSANTSIPSPTLREIANFDYNQTYVYRSEFLYGWIGSDLNISLQQSCARVRQSSAQEIKSNIKRSLNYDRIENFVCNTTFSNIKYNYLYVPIWLNSYKYKDKIYNCYINGITGKVSGRAPKSFWKIFFTVISVIAIIGGIVYFAATLNV